MTELDWLGIIVKVTFANKMVILFSIFS